MAQNSVEERTPAAKLGKTTESNSNGIIKILTHDDASAVRSLLLRISKYSQLH
jgi:hypothetical protein